MNNNEELLRQCIASGQVSAAQVESHRQAGDLSDERSSGVTTQSQALIKLEPLAVTYGEIPTDDNWISVPEALGFTIENRASVDVLVWKDGGCQPATSAEVAMWKALAVKQQAAPKAAPGDEGKALAALRYYQHECSGAEPSISVFHRMMEEALEAAPQQEAQGPVVAAVFDEQLGRPVLIEGAPLLRHGQELYTAPQPAPAPLSEDAKDAARWRMVVLIGNEVMLHPEKRTQAAAVKAYMDATHSGLDLTGAVDAALAAQGGKDA